jgi:hypothetical protein
LHLRALVAAMPDGETTIDGSASRDRHVQNLRAIENWDEGDLPGHERATAALRFALEQLDDATQDPRAPTVLRAVFFGLESAADALEAGMAEPATWTIAAAD